VASRRDDRRRGLNRQREAVEKQDVRWYVLEHNLPGNERAEEDCGPVVYKTFWAEGGGGYSYEPMHRY
jgi:hypothetical protein